MPNFEEIFAAKTNTVSSPDKNITVALTGGAVTGVDVVGGAYSRYTEPVLEEQLVALIKLVIVARRRARRESLAEALGRDFSTWEPSQRDREYTERLKDVIGEAHSERISIYAQPSGFWDVEIQQGALKESNSTVFINEFLALVPVAMTNMEMKVQRVNNDVYGHIAEQIVTKRTQGK